MHKSWIVIALTLLGFGSALAQRVEFPLDVYSYPEIAKRLSVGGRTVSCDPALSQKLAVIGLNSREWNEVKTLLENTLAIRIAPTDKEQKRWRISRAPEVLQRERELRQRWAKVVEQRIRSYSENLCTAMQKAIDPAVPLDEVVQSLRNFDAEKPVPPTSTPCAFTPLYRSVARTLRSFQMDDIMPYIHHVAQFSEDYRRLDRATRYERDEDSDLVDEFLAKYPLERYYQNTPIERWLQQMESLPASELSELLQMDEATLETISPERLRFHLLRQLRLALMWYFDGCWEGEVIRQCIPDVLQAIEQGYVVRINRLKLPVQLARWLFPNYEPWDKLAPDTLVELYLMSRLQVEPDYYTMPIYLSPDLNFDCVRPLIYGRLGGDVWNLEVGYDIWEYRLERMGDVDLLAQYRQAFERHKELLRDKRFHQPLKRDGAQPRTLPLWLLQWAQEYNQELIAELFTLDEDVYEPFRTIAKAFEEHLNAHLYLLDRHDEVWILRNEFAFVDRAADYPMAALRELARSERSPDSWRRFWNAITPAQRRWLALARWDTGIFNQFHTSKRQETIFTGKLYETVMFTLTLDSLTETDRQALLNAAPNTHVRVSLRYLPAHTRAILLEWLSHEIWYEPELLFMQYTQPQLLRGLIIDGMELRRTPQIDLLGKAFHTAPGYPEAMRIRSRTTPPDWNLVYVDPCGKTHYLAYQPPTSSDSEK